MPQTPPLQAKGRSGRTLCAASSTEVSGGTVTVLLHITRTEQSTHRIDGWVDAPPVSVAIVHGADEGKVRDASLGEHGRFEIDGIGAGLVRLRLTVRDDQGALHDMQTPQFEL